MEIIKWEPALSVGVQEIDDQHKKMVKMINNLHTGLETKQFETAIQQTLNDMIEYAGEHFRTEETYMTQFDYAKREDHEIEHEAFIGKISQFICDDDDSFFLSMDVLEYLKSWLLHHIMEVDQAYSDCFTQNGLK